MKVFKYAVPVLDEFILSLPIGAKILSFQIQNDSLYIWALVNEHAEEVERWFLLRGTGHDLGLPEPQVNYIGTTQMLEGHLVWHLFEDIT